MATLRDKMIQLGPKKERPPRVRRPTGRGDRAALLDRLFGVWRDGDDLEADLRRVYRSRFGYRPVR